MAIYARGSVIYADQFAEEDPDVRRGLIELQTHLVYEKQLRNLQVQEARLVRRCEKETAELRRLQKDRAERAEESGFEQNGFEFSNANRKPETAEYSMPFAVSEHRLEPPTNATPGKTASRAA